MSRTLVVIQACREGGPADPRIFRKLGGKSLFEGLIRRATDCHGVIGARVVLGGGPDDDRLREHVPADVPVYHGREIDPLARVCGAVRSVGATSVIRVCADNPFVDPALVDRLIAVAAEHPECDYISYCASDGRPAILANFGIFAEWCSADALELANQRAALQADRLDVTRFMYSHPELFHVRLMPLPAGLEHSGLRLDLAKEEDWDHAQVIFETLGPEELDWQRIAGLLDAQPAIRQRMTAMNATAG